MNEKHRIALDPLSKILLIITVSGILIDGKMKGPLIIVNLILLVIPLLFFAAGKRYKRLIGYGIAFAVGFISELYILPELHGQTAVFAALVITMSSKIMPGIAFGLYVMTTTEPADLLASLKKIHIPNVIVWTICVVFRFFPTVKEELSHTLDAVKIRTGGLKQCLKRPLQSLEYICVPLIMSVLGIGNELLTATLTKGFSVDGKRTTIVEQHLKVQDFIVFAFVIAAWTTKIIIA